MSRLRELTAPELVAAWDLLDAGGVGVLGERVLGVERFRGSPEFLDLGRRFLAVRRAAEPDDSLFEDLAVLLSVVNASTRVLTVFRSGAGHVKQNVFVGDDGIVVMSATPTGATFEEKSSREALIGDTVALFAALTDADRMYVECREANGDLSGFAWSDGTSRELAHGAWHDGADVPAGEFADWLRARLEAQVDR